MSLITQYSRISHHTIFGFTGSTFSVPSSEDFTDGSWSIYDLALSEIGVNETDEKAYIRIGNSIKEFNFGVSNPTQSLADTLGYGNDTGTYSIVLNSTSLIESESSNESIALPNDTTIVLSATGSLQHNSSLANVGSTIYINAEYSTTNASAQIMYTLPLPTDRIVSIDCMFTGLDISGNQAYVNKVSGAIKNIGGALSIIGTTMDIIEKKDFTSAVASIETSAPNVVFVVQGEAGTNINWSMRANYQILK